MLTHQGFWRSVDWIVDINLIEGLSTTCGGAEARGVLAPAVLCGFLFMAMQNKDSTWGGLFGEEAGVDAALGNWSGLVVLV